MSKAHFMTDDIRSSLIISLLSDWLPHSVPFPVSSELDLIKTIKTLQFYLILLFFLFWFHSIPRNVFNNVKYP